MFTESPLHATSPEVVRSQSSNLLSQRDAGLWTQTSLQFDCHPDTRAVYPGEAILEVNVALRGDRRTLDRVNRLEHDEAEVTIVA